VRQSADRGFHKVQKVALTWALSSFLSLVVPSSSPLVALSPLQPLHPCKATPWQKLLSRVMASPSPSLRHTCRPRFSQTPNRRRPHLGTGVATKQ
jgi:hypothetical protein